MVLILDGNSVIGAHVRCNIFYLTCLGKPEFFLVAGGGAHKARKALVARSLKRTFFAASLQTFDLIESRHKSYFIYPKRPSFLHACAIWLLALPSNIGTLTHMLWICLSITLFVRKRSCESESARVGTQKCKKSNPPSTPLQLTPIENPKQENVKFYVFMGKSGIKSESLGPIDLTFQAWFLPSHGTYTRW